MRVVLDTNILFSALISPHGAPDAIYRAWRAARFEVVTSRMQLDEIRRASRYPKLQAILGVTSENGKNRTVSRWHGLASRKRSFLRGFNENQIRASAGMACCFLENHSHIARLKQPSFENHENAVSRGWQLAQSRAVAGYRIS
ncbi:putative toxin-antitoxin system toxin component, PIN family [Pseudomonas aeruginosa]|nr:putative toxin-antitoxin system toxin component, PIN family [Pseudomonas aeruginosa]MDX8066800.1 putative toxin-antitoxin system toxin component, PIN family [Pseudomonas aeruginosa]MDX8096992.1 putative toxin-antitoxin system toxin component, PIN family [Pseudomonas aeruginosa]